MREVRAVALDHGPAASTAERSGEVSLHGERIDGLNDGALRSYWGTQMSMVFQDPMTSLNPVMRIGRQITESLEVHTDLDRAAARDTAVQLLRSVHIPEAERRLKQYPHELSGGMRQRVVIAIALRIRNLLFADEPTTALDDRAGPDPRPAGRAAARAGHGHGAGQPRPRRRRRAHARHRGDVRGQIVEQAPTATLFSEVRMPYTEALLKSVPRLENASHTRSRSSAGARPT